MPRIALIFAMSTVALFSCLTARGQIIVDTFTRPDSTDMGPNWVEQAGNASIVSGRVQVTNPNNFEPALITYTGATVTNVISADVQAIGSGVQYAALVLGYADVQNNLFVKVQNNTGTSSGFDTVFFYYGNNGTGPAAFSGSNAITPFTSGRITLTLAGTVATFNIDTNFDGIVDQTYSRSDVPTANLGSGVGLAFYGVSSMDNFALAAVPEPSTTALLVAGLGLVVGLAYRRKK